MAKKNQRKRENDPLIKIAISGPISVVVLLTMASLAGWPIVNVVLRQLS